MIREKFYTPLSSILVLLVVLICSAVTVKSARAAVIYVNTTVDENTVNSSCSLREAIIAANSDAPYRGCTGGFGADVIMLPSGTYTLSSALPVITSNIEVRAEDSTKPIVQAHVSTGATYRVFEVNPAGYFYINGLVVRNGSCPGTCAINSGGGVYNAGILYVNDSMISGNYASVSGGGIYNEGTMTISNSMISGNNVINDGGGVYNAGTASINYTTISNNSTTYKGTGPYYDDGGGIYNTGSLQMGNTTISSNQAYFGGGIFTSTGSTLTMINCTLSNNAGRTSSPPGPVGGGIYIYRGILNFTNTIIANSSNGDCYNNAGTISTNLNNLVENNTCSPLLSGDPNLSSLRDNGGYTYTHALLRGSLAIDAGDATACPRDDQRFVARPQGHGCDIGAYEQDDFTGPTSLSIVVADDALRIGETSLVTFTFDEAITGFTNADLKIENDNASLSAVSSADGGVTWTATLTPNDDIEDLSNHIVLDMEELTDLVGNPGSDLSYSNAYDIDTKRPTATIEVLDTSLAIGDTSKVEITFSEAVGSFENADLTIDNATLTPVSSADGGVTWDATLTPNAGVEEVANAILLDITGIRDLAGNPGLGSTKSNLYAIDTIRPTVSIDIEDDHLILGETTLVTFKFTEAVTGFSNVDLTIPNASMTDVSSADGGITWTATLTPNNGVEDSTNMVTVDDSGVIDLAGNAGSGTTNSPNYAIDTIRPTATIVVADDVLIIGETSLVTITFSEEVGGFTNADLTVPNGTLTDVSSSDHGITWTATLTPNNGVTDPTNVIVLSLSGVQDIAGNSGTGTVNSNNYVIDTVAPSVTVDQAVDQADPTDNSPINFTVYFYEPIDISTFTPEDVLLTGTAMPTIVSITETAPFNSQNFSLAVSGMLMEGTVIVDIPAGGVQDMAGNVNTASVTRDNVVTYYFELPVHRIYLPLILRN